MVPTTKSPFLDVLPPELRLRIYDYLLVTPLPLKGPIARRTTRYGLDTKILRTNKQIHAEARNAFFSKNTFHITSLPSESSEIEGSGAFEPPLQARDLPLIRHLEIDPLFYPKNLTTHPGPGGWKPVCPAAERYIMNLTYMLTFVKTTLLSLSFKADTRPYASFSDEVFGALVSSDDEIFDDSLDVKKVLTAFHVIEGNVRFRNAVADLVAVRSVAVVFLFPESDFNYRVEKQELCKRGLLFLACQTVFARSEIKIKAMLDGLGGDEVDEANEDEASESGLGSLGGQRRESVGVVLEARRLVEMVK